MKVTLLKKDGKKEVVNRVELADMATAIKNGQFERIVKHTREIYHLMNELIENGVSIIISGHKRDKRRGTESRSAEKQTLSVSTSDTG